MGLETLSEYRAQERLELAGLCSGCGERPPIDGIGWCLECAQQGGTGAMVMCEDCGDRIPVEDAHGRQDRYDRWTFRHANRAECPAWNDSDEDET